MSSTLLHVKSTDNSLGNAKGEVKPGQMEHCQYDRIAQNEFLSHGKNPGLQAVDESGDPFLVSPLACLKKKKEDKIIISWEQRLINLEIPVLVKSARFD